MYRNNYSFSMPKPYYTQNLPKTFPEDIECIIKSNDPEMGSLYISNVEAASNPNTLKKYKIGAVLSCAKGYQLNHPKSVVPHYKYIPTIDHQECDLSIHFDDAVNFITEKIKKTNILVHCIAGVSRSVSMVLAYFIRQHDMHYDQAYHLVKSKRKIIHPNDGFIKQLKKYSDTIKSQKSNAKTRDERSLTPRSGEISVSYQKKRDNYMDKTRGGNTSVPINQRKQEQYTFNTAKKKSYQYSKYYSTALKREEPFQSLQLIPDNTPIKEQNSLTPKTKQIIKQQKYQLPRSSTNYFTPNKHPSPHPNNYESIKNYDEFSKSARLQKDRFERTASPMRNIQNQKIQPQPQSKGRGTYLASMNNELNQKIQMIRKKYDAERQKLYSKYQNYDKPRNIPDGNDPEKIFDKRKVSVQDYRRTSQYDNHGQIDSKRLHVYPKTDFKQQYLRNDINSYKDPYYQRYNTRERRQQSYQFQKYQSYQTRQNYKISSKYDKDYDSSRLNYKAYGYPSYSPLYQYGTTYKRYS